MFRNRATQKVVQVKQYVMKHNKGAMAAFKDLLFTSTH